MKSVHLALFLALAIGGSVACSETADEATDRIDCVAICQHYADCSASDYDVSDCTDRCESYADGSEQQESRLRACEVCSEDRACTDGMFNCGSECSGIVP